MTMPATQAAPRAAASALASPRESTRARAPLSELHLFADINDAAFDLISASAVFKTVRKRQVLVLDQSWRGKAIFVLTGACRVTAVAPNGESLGLASALRGDAIELASALADSEPMTGLRLTADEASQLVLVPGSVLTAASQVCSALMSALVKHLASEQVSTAWRLFEARTLDLRGRLQGELLRLGERGVLQRGAIFIDKPPTQRELAALIGAAREGVARRLSDFESEGLIARRPGQLVITNIRKLVEDYYAQSGRVLDAYAPGGRLAGPWLAQGGLMQKHTSNPGE